MSKYSDEAPGGGLLARLYSRTSLSLLGLLMLALCVGLLGLSVAVFTHAFDDPARVTLRVDRAGSQLISGADVKLSGIVVGRVDDITAAPGGDGATLDLAIERDRLDLIPANVTAQVLPKTIFGEKYVELRLPVEAAETRLADGDVIDRDRSRTALETSTVLNNLAPLLETVAPAQLSTTLTAVATAVQDRGALMNETIGDARRFTGGVRGDVAQLLEDAALGARVADHYREASGPLLRTLDNASVTALTLVQKERLLRDLLAATRDLAGTTGRLVDRVGETLVDVVEVSEPVLALLKKYSPELACTVRGVVKAKERLEAVFADGPYLKARLYVSVSRGMYEPGVDTPRSLDLSEYGPYCPITPTGGKGTVPFPPVPSELDQIRGEPSLGNHVNGLPQLPPGASLDQPAPTDLLPLLLGGLQGAGQGGGAR